MKAKVISVNNQKGGVGKTTTALAMAAILAEEGKRTLLIDCDGSSTTLTKILSRQVGIDHQEIKTTLTDLVLLKTMGRETDDIADMVVIRCPEGYDFLPADNKLVSAATSLSMQNNLDVRFKTLKSLIEPYKDKYDYILFDAAPVLDLFSVNQLVASDELLIVSQCQKASREAINELINSVNQFVVPINPEISIRGVLLTMLDKRTNYGKEQIEEIKSAFEGLHIFETVIPRSVEAERYVDSGESLVTQSPKGRAAQAYIEFTREYLERKDGLCLE